MSSRLIVVAAALALATVQCGRHADLPSPAVNSEHAGHGRAPAADAASHASAGSAPPGYAAVMVDDAGAARLGLTTAPALEREFTRSIRTVGVVTVDETRSSHVHAKVRGWIDSIQVSYTGQDVKQGTTLCTLYSPEVLAAKLELVAMAEQLDAQQPGGGTFADVDRRARTLALEAARRRLTLWDVPKTEIERLERTREANRTFALSAPRPGTVIAKQALAGLYVDASTELYLISDLSRVWVLVDLYETDAPFVKRGDHASLTIEGTPGRTEAKVTFLAPTVDEATRTVKARFELDNRERTLRPGAFATAEMEIGMGRGIGIPESAVIRTGERSIVFVVHGQHIEPREITTGPAIGGWYRVEGVAAGEQVATSAQFLLDSESRIRGTSAPGGGHVH